MEASINEELLPNSPPPITIADLPEILTHYRRLHETYTTLVHIHALNVTTTEITGTIFLATRLNNPTLATKHTIAAVEIIAYCRRQAARTRTDIVQMEAAYAYLCEEISAVFKERVENGDEDGELGQMKWFEGQMDVYKWELRKSRNEQCRFDELVGKGVKGLRESMRAVEAKMGGLLKWADTEKLDATADKEKWKCWAELEARTKPFGWEEIVAKAAADAEVKGDVMITEERDAEAGALDEIVDAGDAEVKGDVVITEERYAEAGALDEIVAALEAQRAVPRCA